MTYYLRLSNNSRDAVIKHFQTWHTSWSGQITAKWSVAEWVDRGAVCHRLKHRWSLANQHIKTTMQKIGPTQDSVTQLSSRRTRTYARMPDHGCTHVTAFESLYFPFICFTSVCPPDQKPFHKTSIQTLVSSYFPLQTLRKSHEYYETNCRAWAKGADVMGSGQCQHRGN